MVTVTNAHIWSVQRVLYVSLIYCIAWNTLEDWSRILDYFMEVKRAIVRKNV